MDQHAIVRSSNGDIYIHPETGEVEHIDLFENGELPNITKFDLPNQKSSEYDILELGFWLDDGKYVAKDESFIKRTRLDREIEEKNQKNAEGGRTMVDL